MPKITVRWQDEIVGQRIVALRMLSGADGEHGADPEDWDRWAVDEIVLENGLVLEIGDECIRVRIP